jgi:hypothetical protein
LLDILKFADARLREPSTWAGLAVLLGMLHVNVDPGVWQTLTLWGTVGAGGLAVLLSEAGGKPGVQVGEDVLAALTTALKAAAPAAAAATEEAPSSASKPAVAAALALLLAGAAGLAACQSAPDQKQALYAVESAYVLVANDEAAAINTGAVPRDAAAAMRATDTTLYAALVAWRTSVEAGNGAVPGAIEGVQTGLQGLVNQHTAAKALSPPALAAADAALSLTAALSAGD